MEELGEEPRCPGKTDKEDPEPQVGWTLYLLRASIWLLCVEGVAERPHSIVKDSDLIEVEGEKRTNNNSYHLSNTYRVLFPSASHSI